MRGDRPETPGGAARDPLGDLRERLARLPASHPSSPEYRQAQECGGDSGPDRAAAGDLAVGGNLAGGDGDLVDDGDPAGGDGDPAGGDEATGDGAAGQPGPDGPHGRGPAWRDGTGGARTSPSPPRDPGSGPSRRGEPFRPWFSSGDGPEPWFSPDSGDRSG